MDFVTVRRREEEKDEYDRLEEYEPLADLFLAAEAEEEEDEEEDEDGEEE